MSPQQIEKVVIDHFEYHKNDKEVILTSDGTCFHLKDASDAVNHMRNNKLEGIILNKELEPREFKVAGDVKAPEMTESDEIRKQRGDAAFDAQEAELKIQADAEAKAEAEAKEKASKKSTKDK